MNPPHDAIELTQEGETVLMLCRCGAQIRGNDEDHARERFAIHHRSPAAFDGLAAARAALEGKKE